MLKIQSVNHVSEHLSAIYPVYTLEKGDHKVVDEVSRSENHVYAFTALLGLGEGR